MKKNLLDWLSYIESLHPKNIAMGLDRIDLMINQLTLKPNFKIIVVAGTNGKGSTASIMESIYCQAGYQVGCYSSPHLLSYNERLRINLVDVSDEALCSAFSSIEAARQREGIALTYFEFGTLAAVWCLMQEPIDVAILEIGLGGRLDAVNAFDSDCAIVTNVALDHQDYLGDTRELIGYEKAGVFRKGKPAILGDDNPPKSVQAYAKKVHADFKSINTDFSLLPTDDGCAFTANHVDQRSTHYALPNLALVGAFQLQNAACALMAVESLQLALPVNAQAIARAFISVRVAGRFEIIQVRTDAEADYSTIVFDVAHNPHAANALLGNLSTLDAQYAHAKRLTIAVFAMLGDKDIEGVAQLLTDVVDEWHVASIDQVRGASVDVMRQAVVKVIPNATVRSYENIALAVKAAINQIQGYKADHENVKIIVFGSFFTVADAKKYFLAHQFEIV